VDASVATSLAASRERLRRSGLESIRARFLDLVTEDAG